MDVFSSLWEMSRGLVISHSHSSKLAVFHSQILHNNQTVAQIIVTQAFCLRKHPFHEILPVLLTDKKMCIQIGPAYKNYDWQHCAIWEPQALGYS